MQADATAGDVIIESRNAVKHFVIKTGLMNSRTAGVVRAVDDISFTIHEGETFALWWESRAAAKAPWPTLS